MKSSFFSAILTCAFAVSAVWADDDDVSLSDLFPQEVRCQNSVGACHSFASIALLEAGLKRRGGAERLSDADLFVRKILTNESRYQIKTKKEGDVEYVDVEILEGGYPYEDIELALTSGVAPQELVTWEKFNAAYLEFLKAIRVGCRKKAGKKDDEKCVKSLETTKAFVEYLKEHHAGVKKKGGVEQVLIGDDPKIAEGRKRIHGKLKGLTVSSKVRGRDFPSISDSDLTDAKECREKGQKQKQEILKHLKDKPPRPVVICLTLKGLPNWGYAGVKKKADALHCVAVTGFKTRGDLEGRPIAVRTRNSWGSESSNFDIQEHELCAINEVYALTP